MAGGIAHDFNNLLTAILGHADLARGEISASSTAGRAIGQTLAAAHRASELVGQLLAYTGHGWIELKPLDLSAEIRGFAEDLRAMAPGQVDVIFELAGDLPLVQAGVREVQHVLSNLVANALEAIGEGGGTVKIRTEECHLTASDLARDYPIRNLLLAPMCGWKAVTAALGCQANWRGAFSIRFSPQNSWGGGWAYPRCRA